MNYSKNSTKLVLIYLVILSCVFSQIITLPLTKNQDGKLIISVRFGEKQCAHQMKVQLFCDPNIGVSYDLMDSCGSEFIDDKNSGAIYDSLFQLGDTQATLRINVLSNRFTEYFGYNSFCLGYSKYLNYLDLMSQLQDAGKIAKQLIFFNINGSNSQDSTIGEMTIGGPNLSLIKRDSQIIELYPTRLSNSYTTVNSRIEIFGETEIWGYEVLFEIDNPFYEIPTLPFEKMFEIFDKKGIKYTYDKQDFHSVFLESIEGLEPIQITLTTIDEGEFPITIKVSQYTRRLPNGQYQLMMKPPYSNIYLGSTLLETYYVGFDTKNQTINIAEKAQQQVHNFKGSFNI